MDHRFAALDAQVLETPEQLLDVRGGQLRERTALQAGEGKGARHEARIAAHRLVPGGERVEHVVVEREQVDIGDRLAAHHRLPAPVDRMAAFAGAADHHQRAAALEGEQELALQEEHRASGLASPQRIAAARRALDHRHVGELGEPVARQPGERRQRAELLGAGVCALH